MSLDVFFHNALTRKPQAQNRSYVQQPKSVGTAMSNIGAVERMMPNSRPVVKPRVAQGGTPKRGY